MEFQSYLPVVKCLVNGDRAGLSSYLHAPDFPFSAFQAFVKQQHLRVMLCAAMQDGIDTDHLPDEFLRYCDNHYLKHQKRHAALLDNLRELKQEADRQGLDFILMKGAHFAQRYYGGIDRRQQDDIDILVRDGDFAAIYRMMLTMGYRQTARELIPRSIKTSFQHALELRRSDITVDVHWCFRIRPAYAIDHDRVWRDRTVTTIADDRYDTLSDEDSLLLIVTSVIGDIEHGKAKLKNFLDLYAIARRMEGQIDWRAFFVARERENLLAITVNVLTMLLHVMQCETEVPSLNDELARHAGLLHISAPQETFGLIAAPRHSGKNRVWYFRLYPGSTTLYILWLAAGTCVKPSFYQNLWKSFAVWAGLLLGLWRRDSPGQGMRTG